MRLVPVSTFLTLCFIGAASSGCGPIEANPVDKLEVESTTQPLYVARDKVRKGKNLFMHETFGGNGRTCLTCHSMETGTLSPAQIRKLYRVDPTNPLFHALDSDDGAGKSYARLLTFGTIRIELPLPPNVRIKGSTARTVVLNRAIPSTLNTPALDPKLMWDLREPTLESQAKAAAHGHAQSTRGPTEHQAKLIALFEREELFSSAALRRYANGGPPPQLPPGRTAAEKRGRLFFISKAEGGNGRCSQCHSGPMLNETSVDHGVLPPGSRSETIFAGELDVRINPGLDYIVTLPDGTEQTITDVSDPGMMLINGLVNEDQSNGIFAFKISSLWNIKNTAPYFHDNSAMTLEDVLHHYDVMFKGPFEQPGLTEREQADIVAYLKLL